MIHSRDEDFDQLQDPANWEPEDGDGIRQPAKSARAIVSVAFSRDDFDDVVDYAATHGMKTSEFIRKATLAYAKAGRTTLGRMHSASGAFRTDYPVNRSEISEPQEKKTSLSLEMATTS